MGNWFVGITKKDIWKGQFINKRLGTKWLDWCYDSRGTGWTNNKSKLMGKYIKEDETLSVVVDRTLGIVGFFIDGKYQGAFKDKEIMTGELHFACSSYYKNSVFEIVKQ